ncbi:hypothetical protein [Aeoliella sp. SH292]|uniref:hypothetical protein n=1 Tax=Aeoliella sp. SH292 TaxID=3454464 RepID=UPI003F96A541
MSLASQIIFVRVAALSALVLSLITTSGCAPSGPTVVPVSGKVLINGQPLTYGYVRFVPTSGRASDGEVRSDGTFKLRYSASQEGALLGEHRVEIAANETLGPTKVKWHAPKRYASMVSSGLTHKVDGPDDTVVFDLKWEGRETGPYEETYSSKDSF